MISLNEVDKLLKSADDKEILTVKNQSTKDIINQVLDQHKTNKIEAKRIAHLFDAGNAYGTCLNIWNFLKYNVPYVVEPSNKQTTKTLSRMLWDAKRGKGNDCKHYSGFTGAILDALGYKFKYRFTGYSKYIPTPTHVYCVCNDNKNEIIIDAVLSGYDVEKPYKFKIDKTMSLYKLSGVNDDAEIGNIFKRFVNNVSQGAKNLSTFAQDKAKQAANFVQKEAKIIANQAVNLTKTMSLAIPRNAFLLLIKFNVNGWASGLKNKTMNELAWWADFGGDRSKLVETIREGAKNKRIFGFDENNIMYPSAVGSIGEPVTISAALASATPIIIKVTDLLNAAEKAAAKAEGLVEKGKGLADKGQGLLNKGKSAFNLAEQAAANFKQTTGIDVKNVIFKKDTGITGDRNAITAQDAKPTTPEDAKRVANAIVQKATGTGGGLKIDNKILMIGGAAALLAIVLLNKKK